MNDDELKEFEEKEDRKWSNLERIQQRMKQRQQQRAPPRQTEFAKKKKLKNIENPEWKEKFEKEKAAKEAAIAEKYKEDMRRKKKLEKEKKDKQEKMLQRKYKEEKAKRPKLPDTKRWADNFEQQQWETQQRINEKYELQKQKADMSRQEFKKKAAEIEKKYDDAKPKKKARDPNKKALVINEENNCFTAVERNDTELLERIYEFYPNDIKRKDKQGNNILHHTINHYERRRNNNAHMIEFLIAKLPVSYVNAVNYLGNTAFNVAVYAKKMECMKAMFSSKDKKRRPNLDHMNINGRTPLMWAAMRDECEILEFLLNCDPGPNIDLWHEKHGKTALTYAVEHNKAEAVRVLVENGANMYIANKLGKTAREMARKKALRYCLKQERVNVVKGCVSSSMVKNNNVPDYIISIIAEFVAAIPQEILDEEQREREEEEKKKKKKAQAGRGRGRGRRGRGRGRGRGRAG
mmetsp:Transcript_46386/g.77098  ORF Transcript_46386/g.77098 Transcript_46386/m.77098 type:complete len:464 (-) Transcript_46386:36-1427(-)